MKGSNDDSFSSCGRSDGSDIASISSSLVGAGLNYVPNCSLIVMLQDRFLCI